MKQTEEISTSPWTTAQQKCWSHVEVATNMTKLLDALKAMSVASVIPILSDNRPTLMLTPEDAGDIVNVKATIRLISKLLHEAGMVEEPVAWDKLPIGDEWMLRLTVGSGIIVDVMTRLPAIKESPIEV